MSISICICVCIYIYIYNWMHTSINTCVYMHYIYIYIYVYHRIDWKGRLWQLCLHRQYNVKSAERGIESRGSVKDERHIICHTSHLLNKQHSFPWSLCPATQQQKLLSTPWSGAFQADAPKGLLLRRNIIIIIIIIVIVIIISIIIIVACYYHCYYYHYCYHYHWYCFVHRHRYGVSHIAYAMSHITYSPSGPTKQTLKSNLDNLTVNCFWIPKGGTVTYTWHIAQSLCRRGRTRSGSGFQRKGNSTPPSCEK